MFQGTSLIALDSKGRISIPSRHRADNLKEVTITRHPDGCVLIYPRAVWTSRRQALSELPYAGRVLQRIVLGSAVDATVDAAGRLLIPAELRILCSLGKDVALVGLGEHLELWDAQRLVKLEEDALKSGLSETVATFRF